MDSGGHSSSAARGSLEAVADTGRSAVQALAGKHKQAAIAGEPELRTPTTSDTALNPWAWSTALWVFRLERCAAGVQGPACVAVLTMRPCARTTPCMRAVGPVSVSFGCICWCRLLRCAGAGVSGPCNPQQRSYHAFFEVLGAGSWLEVVPAGGHMQFASVTSSVVGRALDWLCHSGHTSHEVRGCCIGRGRVGRGSWQ